MQDLKRANIYKVAEIANVSAMTVTRTFNDGPVAEKTKTRILKIAADLGYRPNLMAQSLRSGKTNSIGLLWSLGGPHDSIGVVRNISIRLMRKGYSCHVADSLSDPEIIKQCLSDFCSRNIDGLIVQLNEELCKSKEIIDLLGEINNVIIVTPESIDCKFDNLTLDRTRAIRDIVDYFVENGRKKIVFLTTTDSARENAFIEQIKFHNLAYSKDSIIHVKEDCRINNAAQIRWDSFAKMLKDKFQGEISFDAVICSADEGAAAVINYLDELGCKVPENIAVTGYNNSGMASYFRPPLASVDRRNQDVSESVTEMLLNRIKNTALPPQRELLEMKFVCRKSAG